MMQLMDPRFGGKSLLDPATKFLRLKEASDTKDFIGEFRVGYFFFGIGVLNRKSDRNSLLASI